MLLLAALILADGALAAFVSRSLLMEPVRRLVPPGPLRSGIDCPFCVGFWAALLLVAACGYPAELTWPLAALAVWGGGAVVSAAITAPE